jgi:hypothetical protein
MRVARIIGVSFICSLASGSKILNQHGDSPVSDLRTALNAATTRFDNRLRRKIVEDPVRSWFLWQVFAVPTLTLTKPYFPFEVTFA